MIKSIRRKTYSLITWWTNISLEYFQLDKILIKIQFNSPFLCFLLMFTLYNLHSFLGCWDFYIFTTCPNWPYLWHLASITLVVFMIFFLAIGTKQNNMHIIVLVVFVVLDMEKLSTIWNKVPPRTHSSLTNLSCFCTCKTYIIFFKVILDKSFVFSNKIIDILYN